MSSSVYVLNNGADSAEQKRLNFQHFHLLMPLVKKFLPDVVSTHLKGEKVPHVADIATGTGIWLRELAKELPADAVLDGFDFDTSKFPPADASLPANVTLRHGNILDPFPQDLHGKYDVVHVRLLMYGLKADQWTPAAKNLMTLLKPGGWLHWEESGYWSWLSFPMCKSWTEYIELDMRAGIMFGRDPCHPLRLLPQIRDAGFVDCDDKLFNTITAGIKLPPTLTAIATQSLNGLVEKGGIDGMRTKEDAERLSTKIMTEIEASQPEINCGITWVWGQKP